MAVRVTPILSETRVVLAAVGALGFSCVMTQLALLRELLAAFSGNEMVLGVTLGLWLLLLGLGTALGRRAGNLRRPLVVLAAIQVLLAILPLAQVFGLRALRNVVFIRGAAVGVTPTVFAAGVLLLPYCVLAGYALTLVCALLSRTEGPVGIGCAYVADSVGSIAGGVLFTFVLVRHFDHLSLLIFPALLNLAAAAGLALSLDSRITFHVSRFTPHAPRSNASRAAWPLCTLAFALGAGLIATFFLADLDALSTRLQYPGQRIVARANSPYGRLIVAESEGQYDFIENGVPLISTRDDQHVEETVHYALAQRPDAHRVLLLSGGISGTAREILKYPRATVDYVELDPLVLELGAQYVPDNLADRRIHVLNTDGRLFVTQTAERYDVAIIDVPAPSTAQLNRYYTAEFLAELKRVLVPGGVVSLALGDYENYASPELARMLSSARLTLQGSFRNVLVIPGSHVFLLASDDALYADIASRLEARQINTKLVNHHYLDAMLTPDRMTGVAAATTQPAVANRDFSPVLYYYYLRHWMSQFETRFGPLQVGLVILLGIYLFRLRGGPLVLFASGFAASALEIVLLLAFQVLCGSVYHQVGVVVTVFMVGLAIGAWLTNRRTPNPECGVAGAEKDPGLPLAGGIRGADFSPLRHLAFLIAAYAVLLPLCLPLLCRLGGSTAALFSLKATIVLLTLLLSVLVGMQFPLANQLEFDGTIAGASRLYTADFIGAFLGALLACTLLIPTIGVTGACLLIAALNLLAGALVSSRRC